MTRKDVHLVDKDSDVQTITRCGLKGMPPHRVTTDYQRASCPKCRRRGK